MVPVELAGVQDSSEPTAERNRSGVGPWVSAGRPIREGRAAEEHGVRRASRVIGSGWTGGHPQPDVDHVRNRILRGRRAVHCSGINDS
ncbi:hypothetical protein LINGRAPRIM_LOCUS1620 [Linum grandiflorum]